MTRAPVHKTRLAAWVLLVGAVSALEYAARFSGSTSTNKTQNDVYSYSALVGGLVFYGLILALVVAIAYERADFFAIRRPALHPVRAAAGVFISIYIVEVLVTLLPIRNPGKEQGLTPTHWEPAHAGAFAANVVLLVICAPIIEELTFRGVGQSLLQPFGRWPSILGIGIAFGLWHGLVQAELVLVPFGIGLAYLRDRTRSTIPGMFVHAAFNGLALALSVLT
ncbi:MAG TPA: type II CAAX endopeptidase family protein [Gaiellaceae bacterium]